YVPAGGDTLTIIDGTSLSGTFFGLAEGALVTGQFRVHYDYTNGDAKLVYNSAPVANDGGPYTIAEGSGVLLDGSGSFDPDQFLGDTIVAYEWTINGNIVTTPSATLSRTWSQLQSYGINDGPFNYPISLRVQDSLGTWSTSDATTLTVNDTPPTIGL